MKWVVLVLVLALITLTVWLLHRLLCSSRQEVHVPLPNHVTVDSPCGPHTLPVDGPWPPGHLPPPGHQQTAWQPGQQATWPPGHPGHPGSCGVELPPSYEDAMLSKAREEEGASASPPVIPSTH